MDQGVTGTSNVCVLFGDLNKAVDFATWLNFRFREHGNSLFMVVEGVDGSAVISDDVWEELFPNAEVYTTHGDYLDLGQEYFGSITKDDNRLAHWTEIYDAFANMDTEVLMFILEMKVGLEWFIRHELVFRQKDKNNSECSKEEAEAIWLKEE